MENHIKSGQVIQTIAYTFAGLPIIYHYGLIFIENNKIYVIHNDRINGTIKETYKDFILNKGDIRKIKQIRSSRLEKLSNAELILRSQNCMGNFSLFNYNCEHFLDCVAKKQQRSEQLFLYSLIAISLLLTIKINKK